MDTTNIERYLNSFGKYIVQQSRSNLTKGKKNVSKDLYNSIKFDIKTDSDGFTVNFYMLDYGTFIDKGVSGKNKTRDFKNFEGKTIPSPYNYTSRRPPVGIIEKWIKARGIRGRVDKDWESAGNRGGQFIKDKAFAFLISRSIFENGIKGISFFQRPLQLAFKKFGEELLSMVAKDVKNSIKESTKDLK